MLRWPTKASAVGIACLGVLATGSAWANTLPPVPVQAVAGSGADAGSWQLFPSELQHEGSPAFVLRLEADRPARQLQRLPDRPGVYYLRLNLSCRAGESEVYVSTLQHAGGITAQASPGMGTPGAVRLRFDQEPPMTMTALQLHPGRDSLHFMEPVSLIGTMLRHDRMGFQFHDPNRDPLRTTFDLRGLSRVLEHIEDPCGWLHEDD